MKKSKKGIYLLLFILLLIGVVLFCVCITQKALNTTQNQSLLVYIVITLIYSVIYFSLRPNKKIILSQDCKILIKSIIEVANFINKSIIFTNIFFLPFNIFGMPFPSNKAHNSRTDIVFSVVCLIISVAYFYMNNYIQLQLDNMINKIEVKIESNGLKKVITKFEKVITSFYLVVLILFIILVLFRCIFCRSLLFILLLIYIVIVGTEGYAFIKSFKVSYPPSILTILDSSDFFLKTIFIIPIFKNLLHQNSIYTPLEFWTGLLVLFISTAIINKAKLNLKNNSK